MGIVHRQATITPTKQELVEAWLPTRPWARGRTVVDKVAEYRFDDPEGEVGVETIVWRADDGSLLQTALTYRAAPLEEARAHLVTTMEHSVLGTRWIYDGCGDPVWADTLVRAVLTGGSQSPMFFEREGERVDIPPRMQVHGTGDDADAPRVARIEEVTDDVTTTVVRAGGYVVSLARVIGTPLGEGERLVATLGEDPTQHVLATVQRG